MQLGAHPVQAVGDAVGELLCRGVAPNKHAVPCGLGETGTPATEKHAWSLELHLLSTGLRLIHKVFFPETQLSQWRSSQIVCGDLCDH